MNLWKTASRIKRSVAIMSLEEGLYLRDTVESYHQNDPDAEIIVADSSKTPIDLPSYVKRIPTEGRSGTGNTRDAMALASSGDVTMYSDAHMKIAGGYLAKAMALAWERQAIVVPLCGTLEPPPPEDEAARPLDTPTWRRPGGMLAVRDKHDCTPMICIAWNPPVVPGGIDTPESFSISGLIGAAYIIPRTVLKKIGGWCPTSGWGFNDHSMSIAAFLAGVPILAYTGCEILHKFTRGPHDRYPRGKRYMEGRWWQNAAWVVSALFDKKTVEDIFIPIFKTRPNGDELLENVYSDTAAAHRAMFAKHKIRSDQEFCNHVLDGVWPQAVRNAADVQRRAKYNDKYFKVNLRSKKWHETIAEGINTILAPKKVFDAGCGTGGVVNWFVEHGIAAGAIDWSDYAIKYLRPEVGFAVADLADETLSLNEDYDLCVFTDVAEHIPESQLPAVRENLKKANIPVLVFGASSIKTPDHVSPWSIRKWEDWLGAIGYLPDSEATTALRKFIRDRRPKEGTWRGTPVTVFRRRIV